MYWDLAIRRNREALLDIVAGLIALAGGLAVDPRFKAEGDALRGAQHPCPAGRD